MSCVERACKQIRGSERLAHVLSAVLATGNVLNADTHRGGALAIKLDSLQKMSDVKVRITFPACSGSIKMAYGLTIRRQTVVAALCIDEDAACMLGECNSEEAAKYGAHL